MRIQIVGGWVRDSYLGTDSKDVDVVVTEVASFADMLTEIYALGFTVWQERPEFGTVRAKVTSDHWLADFSNDVDFVMARREQEGDKRNVKPEPGTLDDDLRRRDFTMNAMAYDPVTGDTYDPHGGAEDLGNRILRAVGDPMDRFREDPIRVIRAIRFIATKGVTPDMALERAMRNDEIADLLMELPIERVREETLRILSKDTANSLEWFMMHTTPNLRRAIFRDGLHLVPSLKGS